MEQYSREQYNEKIQYYIKVFDNYNKTYKYIGKDKDGLYLYDFIPSYNKERNVFSIINEYYDSYITISDFNNNVENDILNLFKYGEIILIEDGIERIKSLMKNINNNVNKLFKLLSEVQGVEIKPYDMFDTKTADNITLGPHYLDEKFRRYYSNGIREYNEDTLRGILTGEMKILKCKKAVVLTEDDIICLKYYLKNGYKYIANNLYSDNSKDVRLFKNNPQKGETLNENVWFHIDTDKHLTIEDDLSFIHYYYPEIWDIDELLEQERVSND